MGNCSCLPRPHPARRKQDALAATESVTVAESRDKSWQLPLCNINSELKDAREDYRQLSEHWMSSAHKLERNKVFLRHMPLHFKVGHYNVLAGYLGNNMQPWFLYGPEVTDEKRKAIFQRFNERLPDGTYAFSKWPNYVRGILSEEEIAIVEARHMEHFAWDVRKDRLLCTIAEMDADILSLVECDHYEEHFKPGLDALGYDSIWYKRPRHSSHDGCCLAWNRDMFELVTHQSIEYLDEMDNRSKHQTKDRIAVIGIFRVCISGDMVCFVSTHLARNPEDVAKDHLRTRQLSQLMQTLGTFVKEASREQPPVILAGDMNAASFDRLRGLICTAILLRNDSSVHPFAFDCEDVPTGPTSVTTARKMRIDAIWYQTQRLELVDRCHVPRLSTSDPIPNELHPSDHVPISALFVLKSQLQREYHNARSWYLQIAGRTCGWLPLNNEQLRVAFELYDIDNSGTITRTKMKHAINLVMGTGTVKPSEIQEVIAKVPPKGMGFDNFVGIYKEAVHSVSTEGLENFRDAFQQFDEDEDGLLSINELSRLLSHCSPREPTASELDGVLKSVDFDGDGFIRTQDFMAYLSETWMSKFAECE